MCVCVWERKREWVCVVVVVTLYYNANEFLSVTFSLLPSPHNGHNSPRKCIFLKYIHCKNHIFFQFYNWHNSHRVKFLKSWQKFTWHTLKTLSVWVHRHLNMIKIFAGMEFLYSQNIAEYNATQNTFHLPSSAMISLLDYSKAPIFTDFKINVISSTIEFC